MFGIMAKYVSNLILLRAAPLKPTIFTVCTRVPRLLTFETRRATSRRLYNVILSQTCPLGDRARETFDSVSFSVLLAEKS